MDLFIKGSKTDQRQQGCKRMQQASGDEILCPVKCLQEWFGLTVGSAIPANAPLFSIPKGKFGLDWRVPTREDVTTLMKGAATECKISQQRQLALMEDIEEVQEEDDSLLGATRKY